MSRYFKVRKGYEDKDITLPKRSTSGSAGYDFYAAEDTVVTSLWKSFWGFLIKNECPLPNIVYTRVKAKMRGNEVLFLFNRSSNPMKGLVLANGVGVCDADYFSNEKNDGDIGFAFYNLLPWDVTIKKGQKIGQGVFTTFLKTKDDIAEDKRSGGFGSTGA